MKVGNDALRCDFCADEVKGDFVYYSLDFKEVTIANRMARESENECLSADLCERCMELFRQRVIEIAKQIPESPSRCDVSGGDFSTELRFYRCYVSKVIVSTMGQSHVCVACGKPRQLQEGPCPCAEGSKLVLEAKVDADRKYLMLNFCEQMYNRFKEHLSSVAARGEAQWSM